MIKLYGWWRSLAAYRVRVALNLKRIAYEEQMVDLMAGEQLTKDFKAINPQAAVPALIVDEAAPLTQSLAILEYLEERHPQPPLLPSDPRARARVRSLALLFAADHHPLITPRVNRYLADSLGADDAARAAWSRHWLRQSLEQAQARLAADAASGLYCHGDCLSIADIALTSQWLGARGLGCDTRDLPVVSRIADACLKLDAFARAHPLVQPGAPQRPNASSAS
jgi:maleylacetoacetate isomerase